MNNVKVIVWRYWRAIREGVRLVIGPQWLAVFMIFVFSYTPFLLKYGWGYRNIPYVDLPSFYSASVQVFKYGASPYDHEALQSLVSQGGYVFPYLYPPPSLLFFYPFSLMDYTTASRIVFLGNHLSILLLLFLIPFLLLRAASKHRFSLILILTFVYSLTFFPTVVTLNHGQVNLLLLIFLLAFWVLDRAEYAIPASLFLALAICLKTYPLIILPMLLVIGRKRECMYTSVWLGLLAAISLLVLPSAIWHDWFVNIMPSGGYTRTPAGLFSPAAIWNQNLNGFFARAFTESRWSDPIFVNENLARTLTYAAAGLITTISGMAILRSFRVHRDSLDRTMLVALPTMYLLAPFSWEHHLVYLLPSILMLLAVRSKLPFASAMLFYSALISTSILIGLERGLRFKFYGVIVLWALCIFTAISKQIQLPNKDVKSDE